MDDYPKLRTPVINLILAALCLIIALKAKWVDGLPLPEAIRLFFVVLGLIFGVTGVLTGFDWLFRHFNVRVREFSEARRAGAVALAQAFKGLQLDTIQAIMAGEKTAMRLLVTDDEPVMYIKGLVRDIPWEFAAEFFEQSIDTYPYLYPIWKASNEAWATDLTNLIVARGWADPHKGPFSARLTKPLAWVARRFLVDLSADPETEIPARESPEEVAGAG